MTRYFHDYILVYKNGERRRMNLNRFESLCEDSSSESIQIEGISFSYIGTQDGDSSLSGAETMKLAISLANAARELARLADDLAIGNEWSLGTNAQHHGTRWAIGVQLQHIEKLCNAIDEEHRT